MIIQEFFMELFLLLSFQVIRVHQILDNIQFVIQLVLVWTVYDFSDYFLVIDSQNFLKNFFVYWKPFKELVS